MRVDERRCVDPPARDASSSEIPSVPVPAAATTGLRIFLKIAGSKAPRMSY